MRATVTHDTTTRVITLEVSGVPDVDGTKSWHAKVKVFRPDIVVIRVRDGKVQELEARGSLILKSGDPSTQLREEMSWHPDNGWGPGDKLSTAPEWVRTLWNEAPAGVTSWGQAEVPT